MPLEKSGIQYTSKGFTKFISDMSKAGDMVIRFGEACEKAAVQATDITKTYASLAQGVKDSASGISALTKITTQKTQATEQDILATKIMASTAALAAQRAREEAGALNKLKGSFSGLFSVMQSGNAGAMLGGALGSVLPGLGTALGSAVGQIAWAQGQFVGKLITSVASIPKKVVVGIFKMGVDVGKAFLQAGKKIVSSIMSVVNWLSTTLGKLFNVFSFGGGGGYRGLGENLFQAMLKFEILKQVVRKVIQEFRDYINVATEAAQTLQTLTIRLDNLIARQVRAAGITQDYYKSMEIASGYTQELLGWIQELAVATPFSEETISRTVSLAMAMGWSVEGTKTLTSAILDYSAAQGLSNDVMERIIYNFAQMRQAGKVTGTELRDLARGAFMPVNDILNEAARMLGISADQMDEFREAAADGTIDVETFFQAFINVVNRDFPDAARRMNFTFAAVKDNIRDLFRTLIGWNVLKPAFDVIARSIQKIIESINTPEVVRATKLIGIALQWTMESLQRSFHRFALMIRAMFTALGIGMPSLENIIKSMVKFGAVIEKIALAIHWFVYRNILPAFRALGDDIDKTLGDTAQDAFTWGFNIIKELGKGMMRGISTLLTKVMNFLANMLSGWLRPGSPPRIAPEIDLWGLNTIAEWLHGFTEADFSVLDSMKDSLKGALDALVDLGVLDEEISADMYVSISADLVAAINEFNRTGEMTSVIYEQLSTVAGVFGEELTNLLNAQIELAVATEHVADAQEAYNAAVEATKQSTRTVNTMIKDYNALLRGGADQSVLQARLAELNAAEMQLALDREAEIAAENELEAAEEYLEVVEEMVKLQEELIQQLIDLAKAQADAAKAAAGGGGGGGGGDGGGDDTGLDWGFGGNLEEGEDLQALFEELKDEALAELGTLWEDLKVQWSTTFNQSFGVGSPFRNAWERFVDALRSYWDEKLVPAIGLPSWQQIADIWEGFDLFPGMEEEFPDPTQWWQFPDDIQGESDWTGGVLGILTGISDAISRLRETWHLFIDDLFTDIFTGPKDMPKEGEGGIVDGTIQPLLDRIRLTIEDFKNNTLPSLGAGLGESLIDGMLIGIGNRLMEIPPFAWWIHFMEKVDEFFGRHSPSTLFEEVGHDIVDGFFLGITNFLVDTWSTVESAFTGFVGKIRAFFGLGEKGKSGEGSTFAEIGGELIENLANGVMTAINAIVGVGGIIDTAIQSVINAFKDFLGIGSDGVSDSFVDIGVGIIQGLIEGIQSYIDELIAAAEEAMSQVPDWVKDFIGFGSPAKMFIEIGESIPQGLAVGITDAAGLAQKAMAGATNKMMMSAPANRLNMATVQAPPVSRSSSVNFGDVTVNNGMDFAVFKAQVQRAILEA